MAKRLTDLFPLWAILFSAVAYALPGAFVPLRPGIPYLLGVVMLGMGMTLTARSFALVAKRPGAVGAGVTLQFLLMPALAWAAGTLFGLPPVLLAGIVLVGCCPGGTASNVITYLAGGDVALSITLTSVSTLASVAATPLLTALYVGRTVPVPVAGMMLDVLKIVVAPVVAGVLLNTYLGRRLDRARGIFPLVSVAAIVVIIGIVVALNRGRIPRIGTAVLLAVAAHNLAGLAMGYGAARLLRFDERTCRTLAIEVGMQNSGLGVALAPKYFGAAAALPGAVFSIWHNLTGSFLAARWSRSSRADPPPT